MIYLFVAGVLLVSVGLAFRLGYHVGKQVGRAEPIREQLLRARERSSGVEGSMVAEGTQTG